MMVKVCGLTNAKDANLAAEAGASAWGFVMGGWVVPEEIEPRAQVVRKIIQELPLPVETYLVTHLLVAAEILELASYIRSSGIQVSEYISLAEMEKLRARTDKTIIKTIV